MSTRSRRFALWVSGCLLVGALQLGGEEVVYVRSGASGTGDGSSWANAFTELRDAISIPGATEIWVEAGTYKPGGPGELAASFAMRSGLALYGGFAGNETGRDQRDPGANTTTLSGDLDGDGATGPGNCAHVVRASGTDETAVLDGFAIRGGYAVQAAHPGSSGAGLLLDSTITLRDCVIGDNIAHLGAGLFGYDATLVIEGCRFENNLASSGRGGAVYVSGDPSDGVLHPLALQSCTFVGNTATGTGPDGYGGAVYAEYDNPISASGCSFVGNESRWRIGYGQDAAAGGAALTFAHGSTFDRCLFRGNRSHNGGALWLAGDTVISNCLFVGNEAFRVSAGEYDYGGYAGAVLAYTADLTISGCTLHANRARSTGGVYVDLNSTATVTNSVLWSNTATEEDQKPLDPQIGGASAFTVRYSCVRDLLTPIPGEDPPDPGKFPGCIVIDPGFVSECGPDGVPGNEDDDLRLSGSSPCLDAGDNADIPAGAQRDFAGVSRRHDAAAPDTGSGFPPLTDMGAYELAPDPVWVHAMAGPGQVDMSWSPLGAGWEYTVEWTADLTAQSWAPAPPVARWPTTDTSTVIDTRALGERAFFRVRPALVYP